MPRVVVGGVGAIVEPVPPVAEMYQSKLVPVAVSCAGVEFWHISIGLITDGAAGVAYTFTVTDVLVKLSQVPLF